MPGTISLTNLYMANRVNVKKAIDLLKETQRGSWYLSLAYGKREEQDRQGASKTEAPLNVAEKCGFAV